MQKNFPVIGVCENRPEVSGPACVSVLQASAQRDNRGERRLNDKPQIQRAPRAGDKVLPSARNHVGYRRHIYINMTTITDMVARGWENFVARPRGPLNLRFIIQPTLASIIALRAGLKDANAGRPAYLWAVFTNSDYRKNFLHGGLKDLRIPIVVGTTLDVVYQIIIHRWIYPLELLFTVTLLALVPYLILRGPVNRIASRFVSGGGADAAGKDSGEQSKTIT